MPRKPVPGLGLGPDLPLVDELTLPANLNHLTFSFASLDFAQPGRLRYRYLMEGHDGDWREPLLERKAEYNSPLSPGRYRFRVQGTNRDGVWSAKEAVIGVHVLPPWWATGWAWAAYVAAASALVALTYRQILPPGPPGRSLDVHLAEAPKLQELDEMKSRFLTNITHEFRTPLTLIMGPLERLESDAAAGDERSPASCAATRFDSEQLIDQLLDVARLEAGACRCAGNLWTPWVSVATWAPRRLAARRAHSRSRPVARRCGPGDADDRPARKGDRQPGGQRDQQRPHGGKDLAACRSGMARTRTGRTRGDAPPTALVSTA